MNMTQVTVSHCITMFCVFQHLEQKLAPLLIYPRKPQELFLREVFQPLNMRWSLIPRILGDHMALWRMQKLHLPVSVKVGGEYQCCQMTRQQGTVMWVTNTNSHLLTGLAFPVVPWPPSWTWHNLAWQRLSLNQTVCFGFASWFNYVDAFPSDRSHSIPPKFAVRTVHVFLSIWSFDIAKGPRDFATIFAVTCWPRWYSTLAPSWVLSKFDKS